jgi:DNA-binding MarR family transcriptional regulator
VADSLTFLLGKLGGIAAARFADKLAPHGLKPRHCAVLELADATPLSQLDLANRIGVTPSVVVDMLDELEALGAIRRIQHADDRRRRVVQLTASGQRLRRSAAAAAHEVDAALLDGVDPRAQPAIRAALTQLGTANGLNYA